MICIMFVVETTHFFSRVIEVVVENSFHPLMNYSSTEFKDWKKHYNRMWGVLYPLTHQRCMVELDIVPNHKLLRLFLLCLRYCSLFPFRFLLSLLFLSHNLPAVVFQGNDVICMKSWIDAIYLGKDSGVNCLTMVQHWPQFGELFN